MVQSRARPASRNTRGADKVSINDFAFGYKAGLRFLAGELARGEFRFTALRPHLIPKANGKDRLICVPTVRDRIVQRALLDYLTKRYLPRISNAISYGFVKRRTVREAAERACEHRKALPWVFKTDITSFFDRIDRAALMAATERIVRQRSLHPLLASAAECEIEAPSGSAEKRITRLGIKRGLGVRQGMPLSPFFANIMLDGFDRAVIAAGYAAVRYADDLIFFAGDEDACYGIHAFCRAELGKLGLEIPDIGPDSKSMIYAPGAPAEFLGVGLCAEGEHYVLKLMPGQISKIRLELMHLSSIPELLARKVTLAGLAAQIENRAGGYMHAYEACTNLSELDHELFDLSQKILRKIYADGLKLDLQNLSTEVRTFLGLH
jgi:retron-type reverse transcriptase